MTRKVCLAVAAAAALLGACDDDGGGKPEGSDRGAGVGALGGSARAETLARQRLPARPSGRVAWVADEIPLRPGASLRHSHQPGFVYARRGSHELVLGGRAQELGPGDGAPVTAGRHRHRAGDGAATVWELRLAAPGAPAPAGSRPLFESPPLRGIPAAPEASFIEVTVPPRGGRTTVHTHPGPEFIYQLSGRIEYQNELIGSKRLSPGGAEAIPPDTAVQKRNPFARPARFLSWFLVDPGEPFAPRASF